MYVNFEQMKKNMNYLFEKDSKTNPGLARELINFFKRNAKKKLEVVDQHVHEHNPLRFIENSDQPIDSLVGYTITDMYEKGDCEKIENTVLQLYLGKHLSLGHHDAIWMDVGSTVEFSEKSFTITRKKDGDLPVSQLTVRVLGFENVQFE